MTDMPTVEDVMEIVRNFIADDLERAPADSLTPDYPLVDRDVVDSLAIFQIVSLLEDEFEIEIDDDEITPANFQTLRAMGGFVRSKITGAA